MFPKSSILCIGGVPQPNSAMVFPKKKLSIRLKQKLKMFKKSNFTRSRSRTLANSEDGAMCSNSLQLKAAYRSCHKEFHLKCWWGS